MGVVLQSNLKFERHVESKTRQAKQQLWMIKHVLHDAPEKAKFLAYTSPRVGPRMHDDYTTL